MRQLLFFILCASTAWAHVGSPDVFYEGAAGPYRLQVTIRPPAVIPGVAEIEVHAASPGIREVRIVPLPLSGAGARFAPTPDVAQRAKDDPQFYTGSLWMMAFGSWQVRVSVDGDQGKGEMSVPVPALASRTATMQAGLGAVLTVLLLVLMVGMISIVGASVREAQLEPGLTPDTRRRRRSAIAMGGAAVLVLAFVWLGNKWWNAEAESYRQHVYHPVNSTASVEDGKLVLRLAQDPGWVGFRNAEIIPDHGHLMHLFLLSAPGMGGFWHLHPEQTGDGIFSVSLPAVPAGDYQIFADIVRGGGIPETAASRIALPAVAGRPLSGDDSSLESTSVGAADFTRTTAPLGSGARMVWERDAAPLKSKRAYAFRFRVEDRAGKPAEDLELYMGMPGHAIFVRHDFRVFAHVHPAGSVPMAALDLTRDAPGGGHDMSTMPLAKLPAEVSFPYGFPQPGGYRIFIQIRRAGHVETGVFDTRVE